MNDMIDAEKIDLDQLRKRIEETDLVPSRALLLENLKDHFDALKKSGYNTLADLRRALKNSKNIPLISEKTGIDSEYLILLRREIESCFPKAFPIKAFSWLPKADIEKLEKNGYKNTALLFDGLNSPEKTKKVSDELGIETRIIEELSCLVNLTRIQWVSPKAAKMLLSAGYHDAESTARADAEKMCGELDRVNKEKSVFQRQNRTERHQTPHQGGVICFMKQKKDAK